MMEHPHSAVTALTQMKKQEWSQQDMDIVSALADLSNASATTGRASQAPRPRETLLSSWQATLNQQSGSSKKQSQLSREQAGGPSSRRHQAQVVKLAEGKWQCSDGTTWPSQPSAYRHLRGIRSMNDRLYAFVAHPPFGHLNSHQRGSTNSEESSSDDEATTNSNWMRGRRASPERRPEKHLKVLSHVIDLSLLNSPDPAAYEIARLWTLHGVRQPNTVTAVNAVRRSESTAEGEEPRATVTGVTLDTNHFKTTPLTVPLPTPPSPVNWALAAVPAVDLGDSAKTRRRLLQEFKRPRVPMGAASLAAWAARQARANLQRSLLMAAAAASTPPTE